jgi:membrane protein implicated in regulation of membrane protease activity
MAEWFNALTLDLQIFYGLGCLATLLLVIQLIMTVLGLGEDVPGDAATVDDGLLDAGGDMEHGDGLSLVSTRTIVAFLAGFGWTGAIALNSGLGLPAAVVVALVVGFVLMLMVFWLMRGLYSLRQSGSLDYHNAVGQSGTVYIKIPAAGSGSGQIQVVVQGRLATVAAQTAAPEEIPSGQQVKVTKVLASNTLQVETI